MKGLRRFAELVKLDLMTLPCQLSGNKGKADWHLKHVCEHCPQWRRDMRDVDNNGKCWWLENWSKGNYDIDPHFGVKNWIRQYLGKATDLSKWR